MKYSLIGLLIMQVLLIAAGVVFILHGGIYVGLFNVILNSLLIPVNTCTLLKIIKRNQQ